MFLQLILNGLVNGCIYGLFAMGLVILLKSSTLLNFAHGEFFMLSAFLAFTLLRFHFPYLISIAAPVFILFFIGTFLNRVIFERMMNAPHISLVVITIGLSSLFKGAARLIWGTDIRTMPSLFSQKPIRAFGMVFTYQDSLIVLSTVTFGIVFVMIFFWTRIGKIMRAATQSFRGAALVGINVGTFLKVMWGLSAAIGAFAGMLIAPLTLIYPDMGERILMRAFAGLILGGYGNIKGAIIGSIIIALIENLVNGYISSSLGDLSPFILMIGILLIRPSGLYGEK
jgi:branched-chain amino acid transport system permease protein